MHLSILSPHLEGLEDIGRLCAGLLISSGTQLPPSQLQLLCHRGAYVVVTTFGPQAPLWPSQPLSLADSGVRVRVREGSWQNQRGALG